MMVEVRIATREDLPGVVGSYERVAAERKWIGGEPPIDHRGLIARWDDRMATGESTMFVAIASPGDNIIGGASLEWVGRIGSGLLGLGMWVDAPWRGRGVGKKLLVACIDSARAQEAHKITLEVWPHNEAARAMYSRFGFEEEGYFKKHRRRRSGELWDSIAMGLVLSPADRRLK